MFLSTMSVMEAISSVFVLFDFYRAPPPPRPLNYVLYAIFAEYWWNLVNWDFANENFDKKL